MLLCKNTSNCLKKRGQSLASNYHSNSILQDFKSTCDQSLIIIRYPITCQTPTPTGTQSYRPSTEKQPYHRPQQSVGQSKDLILKKLQSALFQKPKTQSQQVTPKSAGKSSLSVNKYFGSTKKLNSDQPQYYITKVKNVFTKPILDDYFSRIYREHFFQTYQGIYVAFIQ